MLMRNPEYQVRDRVENRHKIDKYSDVHSTQEAILSQIVLILVVVIAILLRAMA